MRAKIQKSMLLVVCITMLGTFGLVVLTSYLQSLESLKTGVEQETSYIQNVTELFGRDYLKEIDRTQAATRITVINPSGEVLYDSHEDEYTFENHAARKEVKEALKYGRGEALRTSSTIGKQTFYYAVRLSDGNILRVSKTLDSSLPTILKLLPYMTGIFGIMTVFAYYLAKWQTKRLIEPINALDLENPLENSIYEELTPLLVSMDHQNKEKEEAANMRKEFSANVSHELKTPLTSISGYAEIMKSGLVKAEDMTAFSERIYNEASRLIVLIEDIIRLSCLDEKSVEFEKEQVDLFKLTREICSRLSPQAEKKNVLIEMTGESVKYFGIKQILDEMIYNICENAVKYNRDGGRVKVWVGNTLQGTKIIVEDTGIGIPKEDQERIFERFYRVDKSHSKETGGTGLGLSIVKHAAILHHAEIKVESEEGKGTKIEVLF